MNKNLLSFVSTVVVAVETITFAFIRIVRCCKNNYKADVLSPNLEHNQSIFCSLFNQSHFLSGILSSDGRLLEINDKALAVIGRQRDEVINQYFPDTPCWSDAADRSRVEAGIKALKMGDYLTFGVSLSTKNSSIINVMFNMHIILNGKQNFISVTGIDITNQKQAERIQSKKVNDELNLAISLSAAQMSISQRIGGTGSFVYDFKTDIVQASNQMLCMFGLPTNVSSVPLSKFLACAPQHIDLVRQTLAGKFGFPFNITDYSLDDFMAVVAEDDPVRIALSDLYRKSHDYDAEFTLQPADGQPKIFIQAIGKIERNSEGTPIKMFGFIQDITERKRVDEANSEMKDRLAQLNQRFLLATDSASIGVWEYFVQENLLVWDQWMYALYGLREEAFSGAYDAWQSGLHSEDKERGDLEIGQALRGEKDFDTEFRVVWPSGEVRHIKANAVVVRDLSGNPLRMIGVNYDITDRKVAEDQLQRALQQADAANLAKSRFLATMSHEIRTPMNGILGMAQLLMTESFSEQQRREFAEIIFSSGNILLTLLNDILDLSKIEAGQFHLENIVFKPDLIISETYKLFIGLANTKGLQIEFKSNCLGSYISDPTCIRQMLSNLVGNAIKFTKKGCIRIEAALIENDGESALLEFSVSDTGMGIHPDKIELLFKPFSQANNSITREFGGSGLGLSIVRNMAKIMGGDVGVESVPGKGSRFWFRLRAKHVEDGDECISSNVTSASNNFFGSVLVVEDNAVNCMVIESMLTTLGVKVTFAHDGQQAINTISQNIWPDIILMDLNMPVMGGADATIEIRKFECINNRPHTPIIALTADAYEEDRQRCLAVGMDDFMTKPITFEILKSTLQKWLPMLNCLGTQVCTNIC